MRNNYNTQVAKTALDPFFFNLCSIVVPEEATPGCGNHIVALSFACAVDHWSILYLLGVPGYPR